MINQTVVLCYYQDLSTATAVLQELSQRKFLRFALIHHDNNSGLQIKRGGLIGAKIIEQFKHFVLTGETLIVIQINQSDVRTIMRALRHVKTEHSVFFLLRSALAEERDVDISSEPLTTEQLQFEATKLATLMQQTRMSADFGRSLLKRLHQINHRLKSLWNDIADGEYINQAMPLSAQWLLDNIYILEGSIENIKINLPKKYYKELPKIATGPLSGLPRIYAIAVDLVKGSAGLLNRENMAEFLTHYQATQPLTIGELWAFPTLLRLRLIEWIQFLAIRVDNRVRESELANFWGNRLLYAARQEPNRLNPFITNLTHDYPSPTGHFAEELLDHLFDEESVLPTIKVWLESCFALPIAEIVHQEQMHETTEQVMISNAIRSLITLSQLSWLEVFESISPVDAILRDDPTGTYSQMDFTTRNCYREQLEILARRARQTEVEVAKQTLRLARAGTDDVQQHVGYYLLNEGVDISSNSGRLTLEQQLGYRPTFYQSVCRCIWKHAAMVYLGGATLLTLVLEMVLGYRIDTADPFSFKVLFFLLSLPLLFELSIQVIILALTLLLPATQLPKMSFKNGIPKECKTLVVIPMILQTPESIEEDVHRLEIRYLANTDPFLYFGLFSDFSDASERTEETDDSLLAIAVAGIEALEHKYGKDKFFLFHRQRVWDESEKAWIGWERKRGKLECLNRMLVSNDQEPIVHAGNAEILTGMRYVITLDADTQLTKDQGRALVEFLSHPLNRPYLSKDGKCLTRGYTIMQPRVVTDYMQSKISWFSRIFSEPAASDPYTQAISNIYQDLVGEGTYHGKGIYDVAAFNQILSNRFPEDHLLSHDLLEGACARTGFVASVCLFDEHPENYRSWAKRKHRWMRGDWQIIDWLWPQVPVGRQGNQVQREWLDSNPLSWSNRWKIFDNLRRACLPISLLVLVLTDWFVSPYPGLWTTLAMIILVIPCLSILINKLLNRSIIRDNSIVHELKIMISRSIITIALLPFEAYLSVDALIRVLYRRWISHRNLLQWAVTDISQNQFLMQLTGLPALAITTMMMVIFLNSPAIPAALPFCFLWLCAPWIIWFIDKPLAKRTDEKISSDDRRFLRHVARKTWRYFDDFVGPQTHWLPPDNYQDKLKVEIAQRTSPTNIGMWLFAVMSAYDCKYITADDLIDKTHATLQELKDLERYEGHFLNWYNIQTLAPLFPRYISTVDSGNLLASLWTLKQGIHEIVSSPLVPANALEGWMDSYEILQQIPSAPKIEQVNLPVSDDLSAFTTTIKNILKSLEKLTIDERQNAEVTYWLKQIQKQLQGWETLIARYFSWVDILADLHLDQLNRINREAQKWRDGVLALKPSMEMLASNQFSALFMNITEGSQRDDLPTEIKNWGKKLGEALSKSQWLASEKLAQSGEIVIEIDRISQGMNLKCLYNSDRNLFAIGYNIDERKLDSSHYDLLASEARIASLVAIAKGDAPLEHWWALGRLYGHVRGRKVLLSWGGTMFEYLMPLLFNKQFPHSLIGDACIAVVACQIDYGRKRGIPWGISESAYGAIDSHRIYQYKSFGIPGIGLKRGLEEDLVVSPYSSALALIVEPQSAIKNLKRLAHKGQHDLMGPFGYYESIDFTRQAKPDGTRGIVVHAYMAHHQGMILSAISNLLQNDTLVKRFHNDPRIVGVSSLLYERIPVSPVIKLGNAKSQELSPTRLKPFSQTPTIGLVKTPDTLTPKVNLLSNQKYSVMVTNTGGGYSRWRDIDISRWRADTTRDAWGSYCYMKDLQSGAIWSTTFQPTEDGGETYSVNFKEDKAEFRRKDHAIETHTEIVVSPDDDAEIRGITLINHSATSRHLELTSYMELALAPHLDDRSHSCFNKLFIETEALPEASALLAFRRLRSPEDRSIWAVHMMAVDQPLDGAVQYETDRARFIGRGQSLKQPMALKGDLSNTVGTVLDPIFSLRCRLVIEPGRRTQVFFITAMASTRVDAMTLVEKYKAPATSHRAIELAWTYAQLELRHLRVHQEEVQLFYKLASHILYPHVQLRAVEERLKSNRLGQSGLWAQGISGDLPLVVVTVGDLYDIDFVKEICVAHAFWNLRGLNTDLIILNEEEAGYLQPLQEQLQNLVQAHSHRIQPQNHGAIYLKNRDQIPANELNLMLCTARVVLVASRGSLRQQLAKPMPRVKYSPKFVRKKGVEEEPSHPLPFMELPYFNGLGGFHHDGSAYVIYLGPGTTTPAPWINVLANPQFGTLVSESGLGCTWYGNSQTNRLTPWSNDPLLDPITDAIYIRDEELGTVWTPTPAPIRETDPYRTSHGQGFTRFEHNSHAIGQDLVIFVPLDDTGGLPLRIQRLRLSNHSSHKRHLTVTAYSEWVLGTDREDTQLHIITEWDSESQAIFAYNRYHPDFGSMVAFSSSVTPPTSFTGNRTEFLGRNRSMSSPEALSRQSLSGSTGTALDPCSALQVSVEINPGEESEVVFILGYAPDAATARQLLLKCRELEKIENLLAETRSWWDKTLRTLVVDVPDLATNFLINRWALYQNLSSRFWGRSGFYQSSGAYGFRDQLQDTMALVYSLPNLARAHILTAASRQFIEGDVQHWWHPQSGGGIRTRFSDDLLWLPFATAHYVRVTGDSSILCEQVSFLEAPQLLDTEQEVYQVPIPTKQTETLLEHCRRALQKGSTAGPHGLPLIGCGDWNDGMNRVGVQGKGESVWLAWFLIHVMHDFADLLNFSSGNEDTGVGFRVEAKRLAAIVEATAWDGAWYRRAYFDDGHPLGTKEDRECTIDSIAQSWSVISGLANPERSAQALKSAEEHLIKNNLVLLLAPPFDKTHLEPGYIKGYPPGVRENGGQYTHGSLWLAMAYARSGNGSRAVDLLRMMSPILHTSTPEANALYKVEPYVIAADIYSLKTQVGRGGWTWYTGSAAWIYRIWLEEILGFKLRGQMLTFTCRMPTEWKGFKISYRYQSSHYDISVMNQDPGYHEITRIELDGVSLSSSEIPLVNDGKRHTVTLEVGWKVN